MEHLKQTLDGEPNCSFETLTWLLNKHWEKAEGHLDRLLETLVTDLPGFGGFPRDAVH